MADDRRDPERDRFSGRLSRFAKVGAGLSGAAVSYGANRVFGGDDANARNAKALKAALGGLKGPLMKAAQMFATVPDLLSPEFAKELGELQTNAPAMGWPFVRRRMAAELGPDWQGRFASFEHEAAAAASLGQVHRATTHDGRALAVKLQYPDMQSAVESDLGQLRTLIGLMKRMDGSIDPSEAIVEIGDRLREELDYAREAKLMTLYGNFFAGREDIRTPTPVPELSTGRLLSMTWLDGQGLLAFKDASQETRDHVAALLFDAWWSPMTHLGIIHGDPHLGNYTFGGEGAAHLNLLDFGCIRIFPPKFVAGVVRLYRALSNDDRAEQMESYRSWGFTGLTDDLVDALNVWARFIYGPLLDDRIRTVADDVPPGEYGRREAFRVRQALKAVGGVTIPREFVFMDRAAIGLGAAFLHLGARHNWRALFEASLEGFSEEAVAERQAKALAAVGL
ncbi:MULTISPECIES: AarF/ABC1/UbiB kinase family protein [unclassified Caulobacter]|uniref:ABC1 kinase family protein n=1 Tax=unclassified Caulobacter TaxID=2648921 RepID=UPI0006FF5D4E|nr:MULTISPECIES: AarF/UbiB family protein [unclassified Caulobacter]KQV62732.1 ABC transporter ATP-binding protein [Caulobacter sp. Root342]KQV71865.1 ABC transporter ATP-binding protein [Caulobacter sp. Root343]